MKLASMVIAAGLMAVGLIAGLFHYHTDSAKTVVTKLSSVVATFAQLDLFTADGDLNVFTLLFIGLGFPCFITLRGT
jgi:hypothetical protein